MQLISVDLLERRKEYGKRYWEYRQKLTAWNQLYKQKMEATKNIFVPAKRSIATTANNNNQETTAGGGSSSPSSTQAPSFSGPAGSTSASPESSHRRLPGMSLGGTGADANMVQPLTLSQLLDIRVPGLKQSPKTGLPVLCHFCVLPKDAEVIRLIEKGFVLATTNKEGEGGTEEKAQ